MNVPNITLPNGSTLDFDNVPEPKILGYEIVHSKTGFLHPATKPDEIYSKMAGIKKMSRVAAQTHDIFCYVLNPLYEEEVYYDYTYIDDPEDYLLD